MSNTQIIASDVEIGEGVQLYHFINLYGCKIGDNSRIGSFVEVQKGVSIGSSCKISSHSFICEGVTIEDEVFVGHNVTFINDRVPRAASEGALLGEDDWVCEPTLIRKGVSIGSSVTILCGVTVGENAVIGAGAVVTKDVPANSVVAGVPARLLREQRMAA